VIGKQTPNPANKAVFCLVVGASGSGKTTYLRRQLDQWETEFSRVVLLDPRGQFQDEPGARTTRELVLWLDLGRVGRALVSVGSETDKRIALAALWRSEDTLIILDELQLYGDQSRFFSRTC